MAALTPRRIGDSINNTFVSLIRQLKSINIENNGQQNWCSGEEMEHVQKFVDILALVVRIIDETTIRGNTDDSGSTILEKHNLVDLYTFLYNISMANIRYFSKEIMGSTRKYADTPLVVIYFAMATIILFMEFAWPTVGDMKRQVQKDIPYCVKYGLDVVDSVTIDNFSTEELIVSMNKLAYSAHDIVFSIELVEYIDALEYRLCELMLNVYDEDIHNVEKYRTPFSGCEGGFVLSSDGEFMFIIAILSLRHLANGGLQTLRTETHPDASSEDYEMAHRIRGALAKRASAVYGTEYKKRFKGIYEESSTTTMEGFLHLKSKNFPPLVKPSEAIKQFRANSEWRSISERTDPRELKIQNFLFNPEDDFMGFKIAFNMMMNMFFQEFVKDAWTNYCFTGNAVAARSVQDLDNLLVASEKVPFFIESLNEACILVDRSLIVFGRRPVDYFLAVYFWLIHVGDECDYMLPSKMYIHTLYKELLGFTVMKNTADDEDSDIAQTSRYLEDLYKTNAPNDKESAEITKRMGEIDLYTNPEKEQEDQPVSIAASSSSSSSSIRQPNFYEIAEMNGAYYLAIFDRRVREKAEYRRIAKQVPETNQDLDAIPASRDMSQCGLPPISSSKSDWEADE